MCSPISCERSWMYRWTAGWRNCPVFFSAVRIHVSISLRVYCSPSYSFKQEAQYYVKRLTYVYQMNLKRKEITFKSASNDRMDELTASSVNSGNSFKHFKKVVTSFPRKSNWWGNVSGSRFSVTVGLGIWSSALPLNLLNTFRRLEFVRDSQHVSRVVWTIFWGNISAAFSW